VVGNPEDLSGVYERNGTLKEEPAGRIELSGRTGRHKELCADPAYVEGCCGMDGEAREMAKPMVDAAIRAIGFCCLTDAGCRCSLRGGQTALLREASSPAASRAASSAAMSAARTPWFSSSRMR